MSKEKNNDNNNDNPFCKSIYVFIKDDNSTKTMNLSKKKKHTCSGFEGSKPFFPNPF